MNNALLARTQEKEVEFSALSDNEASIGSVIGSIVSSDEEEIFEDASEAVASYPSDKDPSTTSHTDESISDVDGPSKDEDDKVEKNPWTKPYVGIPVNYFSVGIIYGGSVSVLYPLLVVQHGVTSAFYSASASLVTLFWSYKIIFGMLCDCFPLWGQKWKPYIIIGWALCAAMLVALAFMGEGMFSECLYLN